MSDSLINYPYNNRILIQETGSGMYFMPGSSGILSGNWHTNVIPTESTHLINKGYLESGNFNLTNVVRTTGDQIISGQKTFLQGLTISGDINSGNYSVIQEIEKAKILSIAYAIAL